MVRRKHTFRRQGLFLVENPDLIGNQIQYAEEESKAIISDATESDGLMTLEDVSMGYYEVRETVLPKGYITTGDGTFYIRIGASGTLLPHTGGIGTGWLMILGWLLIAFAAAVQIFRKCSGIGVTPAEMVAILEKQKK